MITIRQEICNAEVSKSKHTLFSKADKSQLDVAAAVPFFLYDPLY